MFITEKMDKTIKARHCANGSTQRSYIPKEKSSSPTVSTDSVLITGVIDAKQQRDVMTIDMSNAFVQTDIPKDKKSIIMKIRGRIIDLLLKIDHDKYKPFVCESEKSKILYVRMKKALYGMLVSSILYYKKFRKDIERIGYEVNPCDICVANKMIRNKQHTIT